MDILGWVKLGGAIIVGLVAMWLWHTWEANAAAAAKVPVLTKQLNDEHAKADDLANQLAASQAKRDAAEKELADWQGLKGPIIDALKQGGMNAAASKIKACLPSADDRRLRNEAIQRLLGSGPPANAAPVPPGSGKPTDGNSPAPVPAHG